MLRRTLPTITALTFALATLTACGGDDGGSADEPSATTATAETTTAGGSESTDAGDDAEDGGECGGITTAEVSDAAGGVPFDDAADTSVDQDTSCTFTFGDAAYGVTVTSEPTATYLGGELDGANDADALDTLGLAQSIVLEEGAIVTTVDVDGHPSVTVAGQSLVAGAPSGYAATVLDGTVTVVTADGDELGDAPDVLVAVATGVLAIAID